MLMSQGGVWSCKPATKSCNDGGSVWNALGAVVPVGVQIKSSNTARMCAGHWIDR